MANVQVKNLPDDLHSALRERARQEGVPMSDLIVRLLRRELALPSLSSWLEERAATGWSAPPVDSVGAVDAERGPWPTQ